MRTGIIWGTDSIWYGSPQDQIQAFRAFQISAEYQEKYRLSGADIRRQAQDLRAQCRTRLRPRRRSRSGRRSYGRREPNIARAPNPSFRTYGPSRGASSSPMHQEHGGLRPEQLEAHPRRELSAHFLAAAAASVELALASMLRLPDTSAVAPPVMRP